MRAALFIVALALASSVFAQADKNGDPTPRKGLDPIDAAKVKQVEAQRWIGFGAKGNQVEREVSGSIPGQRSCTTNIGPAAPSGSTANANTGFGRQRSDSVVVVTGSVINVCR